MDYFQSLFSEYFFNIQVYQNIFNVFLSDTLFFSISLITIFSALFTIIESNMARSAVHLTLCFASIAILYFLLNAPLVGIAQVLIYSIGVTLLVLFAIMLVSGLNEKEDSIESSNKQRKNKIKLFLSVITCTLLFVVLGISINFSQSKLYWLTYEFKQASINSGIATQSYDLKTLGAMMFQENLLAFELVSVMLMVLFIGAIIVAKRKNMKDE